MARYIIADPKLKAAFDNVKKDPRAVDTFKFIDAANVTITVTYSSAYGGSRSDGFGTSNYSIYIDSSADSKFSKKEWGTRTTISDEIAISHELGHIEYDILLAIGRFKKGVDVPPGKTADEWEEIRSECFSRYSQNKLMPFDDKIPLVDKQKLPGHFIGTLDEIGQSIRKAVK